MSWWCDEANNFFFQLKFALAHGHTIIHLFYLLQWSFWRGLCSEA